MEKFWTSILNETNQDSSSGRSLFFSWLGRISRCYWNASSRTIAYYVAIYIVCVAAVCFSRSCRRKFIFCCTERAGARHACMYASLFAYHGRRLRLLWRLVGSTRVGIIEALQCVIGYSLTSVVSPLERVCTSDWRELGTDVTRQIYVGIFPKHYIQRIQSKPETCITPSIDTGARHLAFVARLFCFPVQGKDDDVILSDLVNFPVRRCPP